MYIWGLINKCTAVEPDPLAASPQVAAKFGLEDRPCAKRRVFIFIIIKHE